MTDPYRGTDTQIKVIHERLVDLEDNLVDLQGSVSKLQKNKYQKEDSQDTRQFRSFFKSLVLCVLIVTVGTTTYAVVEYLYPAVDAASCRSLCGSRGVSKFNLNTGCICH